MIKIYGMKTCPDCQWVEAQVKDDDRFQVIDIGDHVRHLKAFLRLRDQLPVFDDARRHGYAGIPCFVLEAGAVPPVPGDGAPRPRAAGGPACRLDGRGGQWRWGGWPPLGRDG